eukprot:Lankesteria_metandrocarpae@DN8435_c0_g1_i1.p1
MRSASSNNVIGIFICAFEIVLVHEWFMTINHIVLYHVHCCIITLLDSFIPHRQLPLTENVEVLFVPVVTTSDTKSLSGINLFWKAVASTTDDSLRPAASSGEKKYGPILEPLGLTHMPVTTATNGAVVCTADGGRMHAHAGM